MMVMRNFVNFGCPFPRQQRCFSNTVVAAAGKCPFPLPRPTSTEPPVEYKHFREADPVPKAALYDGSEVYLLARHKDISKVLDDLRLSKERGRPGFPELSEGGKQAAAANTERTFVDMDPPQHTKYRGMVESWFSPQKSESMRPFTQAAANELVDVMLSLSKQRPVDLMEAFATPLPFKVIYALLGIPFSDYQYLSTNVAVRASASGSARDASSAQEGLMDYMNKLVGTKEQNPTDDIISDLVVHQLKPGHISRPELVQTAFLLLVAGNATVSGMIALGLLELFKHPDQLQLLKSKPEMIDNAVEEILRFHTASSFALRRVAKEPMDLGYGKEIKPGEPVIALNQSANRDAEVFGPNPDEFDIRRPPGPHMAFGYGRHECVAMHLSRMELQVGLSTLLARVPSVRLAGPESEVVKFSPPTKDIGISEMKVTWDE